MCGVLHVSLGSCWRELWDCLNSCELRHGLVLCRDFAEVLDCVKGPKARVVAVTSQERAEAADKERPGFFAKVHKTL